MKAKVNILTDEEKAEQRVQWEVKRLKLMQQKTENPFKKIKAGSQLSITDNGLKTIYLVDDIIPDPNDDKNKFYTGTYSLKLSLVTIQET